MAVELVTAPTVPPVSLADLKAHLRVDHDDDDAYIAGLAEVATTSVEDYCQRALVAQTWRWILGGWPNDGERVPRAPFGELVSISYVDADGATQSLEVDQFTVAGVEDPRIYRAAGVTLPSVRSGPAVVTITFTAGYEPGSGDDTSIIPAPLRHAVAMTVAHFYENREATLINVRGEDLPRGVDHLLARYRVWL